MLHSCKKTWTCWSLPAQNSESKNPSSLWKGLFWHRAELKWPPVVEIRISRRYANVASQGETMPVIGYHPINSMIRQILHTMSSPCRSGRIASELTSGCPYSRTSERRKPDRVCLSSLRNIIEWQSPVDRKSQRQYSCRLQHIQVVESRNLPSQCPVRSKAVQRCVITDVGHHHVIFVAFEIG